MKFYIHTYAIKNRQKKSMTHAFGASKALVLFEELCKQTVREHTEALTYELIISASSGIVLLLVNKLTFFKVGAS